MNNFKAYVVRYDNKDPRNFIPISAIPSELFDNAAWKRNQIKEVHVIASIAFVANTGDKLREYMLPLQSNVLQAAPMRLEKRTTVEHAAADAMKFTGEGFEKELERHAK